MDERASASAWGVHDATLKLLRPVLVYASIAASLHYILWRITASLPPPAWGLLEVFAFSLVGVEALAIYILATGIEFPRDARLRPTFRPFPINWCNRTPEVNERLDWYGANAPHVDIFITTYDEEWNVLEKTLVGALHQEYPSFRVWVLDDGRRDWLRERVRRHGSSYLSRSENHGYKAGNINHALEELRARGQRIEFIALLDADFIARPQFLRRTMALMEDACVGIVQTPQAFYNPDPFQQAFGVASWPEEQREWFDVDEPALDATDDALCCGTACMVRGEALDAIGGGFPTESVTEDTLCSAKMKRAGWRTVYLSERLCVGLAAEGLHEWFTQRVRWLVGDLQNRKLNRSPRHLYDRMNYWLSYFHLSIKAARDLGWTLALTVFWWSGSWVIDAEPATAAAYFVPLWTLHLPWIWLTGGRKNFLVLGPQFKLQRFMWLIVPIRSVLSRQTPRFEVTQKARRRSSLHIHWGILCGHVPVVLGLGGGIAFALLSDASASRTSPWFWANAFVSTYFIIETLAAIAPAFERPQRRSNDRYTTMEDVALEGDEGRVSTRAVNISLGGVLVEMRAGELAPRDAVVRISDVAPLRAQLVRRDSDHRVAYRFESREQSWELIQKIYCRDGYVPLPERWRVRDALKALVLYLATPGRALIKAFGRALAGQRQLEPRAAGEENV